MSKNIKTEAWGVKAGAGLYTITNCKNPLKLKKHGTVKVYSCYKDLQLLKNVDDKIIVANLGNKHITSMLNYLLVICML